jgi:DNA-binding NarL/FixJ family response regulator
LKTNEKRTRHRDSKIFFTFTDTVAPCKLDSELRELLNALNRELAMGLDLIPHLVRQGIYVEILRHEWERGLDSLSPRKREAAPLLLKGMTHQEVGETMEISKWTAKHYGAYICRAMRVNSIEDLRAKYGILLPLNSDDVQKEIEAA